MPAVVASLTIQKSRTGTVGRMDLGGRCGCDTCTSLGHDAVITNCGTGSCQDARNVLKQPELRSVNWFANELTILSNDNNDTPRREVSSDFLPEILEQPVWEIDFATHVGISCVA